MAQTLPTGASSCSGAAQTHLHSTALPWVRRVGRWIFTPSMAQALPQGCRVSVPRAFSM